MKKLMNVLTIAFFAVGLITNAFAQCTPHVPDTSGAGLSPRWQDLECANNDASAYTDTIYLQNFDTIPFAGNNVVVQSLTVNSITGAPAGLTYEFDNGSTTTRTYTTGETGCVRILGSTTVAPGRYKLAINVTVVIPGIPLPAAEACDLYSIAMPGQPCPFQFFINVKTPTAACDTNAAIVSSVGLINIKDFSISPNPMQTKSTVTFFSQEAGVYDFQLRDLAGKSVRNEQVNVVNGNNEYDIVRNDLSAGVYFMVLSKDGNSLTQKLTVSK